MPMLPTPENPFLPPPSQGVDNWGQTHLDMWRGAENIDDRLGHIFRSETLSIPGE